MQAIAELELPYLPVDEARFAEDPFPYFAAARQKHPWLAKCPFAYVPTTYDAIREVMAHEDKMKMGYGDLVKMMEAEHTPWGQFLIHNILNEGGAVHRRQRDALAPVFTPRQANKNRALMREVINGLLDEWLPKRAFDFELFASYYPISVSCRIIGASPAAVPRLRSSLEVLGVGGSFDKSLLPGLQASYFVVEEFVHELIADRKRHERSEGDPDLLDRLIEVNGNGGISDQELVYLVIQLLVAGYDTSRNALTLVMHLLLDRPADYERCAADLDFCRSFIEETLRYYGVASSPRVVTDDICVRDVRIPKGTMIFLPWGMSGRDPRAFDNPNVFDPQRPKQRSPIGFGLGPHICLGQFIARAQLEEGLHIIARRMKGPKRNGTGGWRAFPGIWGIRGLPIVFDPSDTD
jgi:cytochrome P450